MEYTIFFKEIKEFGEIDVFASALNSLISLNALKNALKIFRRHTDSPFLAELEVVDVGAECEYAVLRHEMLDFAELLLHTTHFAL